MSKKKTIIEFGNRLGLVRKGLRLTQKEMAEKLKIAVSTYQHYERGESEAPISIIEKIIGLAPQITKFGYSLEWFLTGEESNRVEKTPNCNSGASNNIVEIHKSLVEKFIDKRRAKAINEVLLEIERLDAGALEEVQTYLTGVASGLKIAAGRNSSHERRQGGDYEGGEGRSGKERRKTAEQ